MTPSFDGWITFYVFLKPWLGSFSLAHFPFRDWRDTAIEEQLATGLTGFVDLAFVLVAGIYLYRRWDRSKEVPLCRAWLVFLGLLLLSVVAVSTLPLFSLRRFLKVLVFFLMYAAMYVRVLESQDRALGYLRSILWAAWIPVTYGLVSFLVNAEFTWAALANRDYREYSTFIHANPFAYF